MKSQIYLMLLRDTGSWPENFSAMSTGKKFGAVLAVTAATILKQIPKDMVDGDSLDVPFIKFIRCDTMNHSISFPGASSSSSSPAGSFSPPKFHKEKTDSHIGEYTDDTIDKSLYFQKTRFYGEKAVGWDNKFVQRGLGSALGGNHFIKNHVPEHGEIEFTKGIDSATAQLAYGCAAQEQFPLAAFFYRRKAGLGLAGVRWPYFVVGLYKNKIKSWSMEGDSEKVKLSYSAISWCGYDQWADTNISYPWSTRWFDQEAVTGGQGGFAALLQALAAGLIMAAGGISAAATAGPQM